MKIRYLYSACILVETEDSRILCDPWFSDYIYEGSWIQYPPLAGNPSEIIGQVDYIYISHLHPDHFDPKFLRNYLSTFPSAKIIIGKTNPDYLANKLRIENFDFIQAERFTFGNTHIYISPNSGYDAGNIDTAALIYDSSSAFINMNDNPFDGEQVSRLLTENPHGQIDFACLPYAGAGPYPQTYHFENDTLLKAAAQKKKLQFIALYEKYISAISPIAALPFAGKYWLAGPLAALNANRGVADPVEIKVLFPVQTCVLADGGLATYCTQTRTATSVREKPYNMDEVKAYIDQLKFPGFDYAREIQPIEGRKLPIFPLLKSAAKNAMQRCDTKILENHFLTIVSGEFTYVINLADESCTVEKQTQIENYLPRLEIHIDERYLFGLLTRLYHWDNGAIGSMFFCKRIPDVYNPFAINYLNFFQA